MTDPRRIIDPGLAPKRLDDELWLFSIVTGTGGN